MLHGAEAWPNWQHMGHDKLSWGCEVVDQVELVALRKTRPSSAHRSQYQASHILLDRGQMPCLLIRTEFQLVS